MMRKRIFKTLAIVLAVGVLMLAGYLAGKSAEHPAVETWTVEESSSMKELPSDRALQMQIRAIAESDPVQAATMTWQHEDPWFYGLRSGDDWIVPGVSKELLKAGILPVKVIAWTGRTANDNRGRELDRIAEDYASKFNRQTLQILSTN